MLEVVKFLLFLLIFVLLPGRVLLSLPKIKLSAAESFFLSGTLGIVFICFLAFVLGYLKVGFLVFPLLIGLDLYLIAFKKWRPDIHKFSKKYILPISVIGLGAAFQSILLFKSGTIYQGGLAFWGVNGYDAIWHSALVQELTTHFPPQNPGFAGESLKNYHFLIDLFLAQAHKATGIGILDLYFRFAPAFFTILLNSLIYLFLKRWSGKTSVALWGIFFVSIAGSFGWVPPFFGKGSNNWETAFWSIQTPSSFINPPFGVSLVILSAGLLLFNIYLKQPTFRIALILSLLFGSLIGFKSYAGVIVLGALAVMAAFGIFKRKWHVLILFGATFLISLMFYLPVSAGSTDYFVWKPWWFIQTMIEAPDRLNWSSLELRRQVYALHSNWRNIFILQAFAFLIFLFGNLGTRFFGFLAFRKKLAKEQINQFLLILIVLAFFPPIFFIQKVVPWNAIQFFYYFIFLFSFLAAEGLVLFFSKIKFRTIKVIVAFLIISSALPSTIETIHWFTAPVPTTLLDQKEIEALKFLKDNSKPSDVLLTYPFGEVQTRYFPNPPVPMTYYNSPYVSFFTGRRIYLEDQNAANLLSYDAQVRLNQEKEFFKFISPSSSQNFLINHPEIRFLYLVDDQGKNLHPEEIGLKEVFNNQKVRIYKVGW